ncbi:MAG TPA: DUF924 family protein [Azospirillaceae bacterium]|nr:DUF924 family protein [Azospirillaceae bacterium]
MERGHDLAYPDDDHRLFFYLPFEHAENLEEQNLSTRLFSERTRDPGYRDYAERHRRIIERFERFPYRNTCLGRASTPEALAFLQQPGSSF